MKSVQRWVKMPTKVRAILHTRFVSATCQPLRLRRNFLQRFHVLFAELNFTILR
jgi:hypothetical protein